MRHVERRRSARTIPRTRAVAAGALLSVLAAIPATAQTGEPGAASAARLGDLYAQVRRDNPKLVAARALARASETRVSGASRPPDPLLQLGFMNYAVPNLAPMPVIGMAQLQVMQMLPLGGKLALAGRAAGAEAAAAGARTDDLSWELRDETAMAFYDLYAADGQLGVAREMLRQLADIATTAETMYRLGDGRQADVLRAQVEVAKMAQDTLRMQAMRQTMAARLNALLDRASEAAFAAAILPAFPDSIPARAWIDSVARDERPLVRAGLDELRGAEISQARARKEIWPDLQVGVQYGQRGGEAGSTERMGSVMFGASIPVFARDRQLRARDEAGAMTQVARADLAAVRADTRGKIGEAYANLTRARSLAQVYRTTVLPQAEATAASALAAYRVGTVDFMTLLDARMSVNTYRRELFVLQADQGKAWADLEMLIGRELFDPNRTVATTTMRGAQ